MAKPVHLIDRIRTHRHRRPIRVLSMITSVTVSFAVQNSMRNSLPFSFQCYQQ